MGARRIVERTAERQRDGSRLDRCRLAKRDRGWRRRHDPKILAKEKPASSFLGQQLFVF